MKKYLLFAGEVYYPGGGWIDFKGSFDSVKDCINALSRIKKESDYDWYEIVDRDTQKELEV